MNLSFIFLRIALRYDPSISLLYLFLLHSTLDPPIISDYLQYERASERPFVTCPLGQLPASSYPIFAQDLDVPQLGLRA